MKEAGKFLFKYRSYTPLPFIIFSLIFMNPTLLSIITGFILSLSGEAIRIWSVGYAGSETRTTSNVGGSHLVTQGPYSLVRNPLYLGNILIYTGIGIMSFALFPFFQIFALLFFSFQYYCIIIVEEEFLQTKFQDIFSNYKQSVNRFIPGKKPLPEAINSKLDFKIEGAFKSERRSLQAFILVSVIIIGYYIIRTFTVPRW